MFQLRPHRKLLNLLKRRTVMKSCYPSCMSCMCASQRLLHRGPINGSIITRTHDISKMEFTLPAHRLLSTHSRPQILESVTVETVLSDTNKQRVRGILESSSNPVGIPGRYIPKAASRPMPDACVLIPLCTVNGEPSILFTLRSSDLEAHRGEVSFPGGRKDDDDKDLIHTALRECEEELGVKSGDVDVWGIMRSPVPSKGDKYAVYSVIANLGEIDVAKLKLDRNEVAEAFTSTISSLCHPQNARYTRFRVEKIDGKASKSYPDALKTLKAYTMPVYSGQKHRIWGLTAIFLHFSLMICCPGLYNQKLRQ